MLYLRFECNANEPVEEIDADEEEEQVDEADEEDNDFSLILRFNNIKLFAC